MPNHRVGIIGLPNETGASGHFVGLRYRLSGNDDDAYVRPAVMHLPGERQPAAPARWSAGRFVIRSGHTPEEPAAGRESQNTRLGELFIDRPVSVTGRNPVASWGRERAMVQPDRLAASLTEEGRYQLLIEAVTDCAIYMLGPTGIVTSWNPGAQRFKGYAPAEIIGQHFSRFYTEEDQKTGLPARALEIAEREGKFENEGWRVRKDGTRFWAYVVIDPIRRPSGEIVGFAKITRDLTERREAQEKLDKTREALLHSQKMDAIGQLTGGIAHDFNNLLMVVIGSLELMRKRLPDDPKLVALHKNAVQGAQRGATLTKRMLAFARRQSLSITVAFLL